MNNFMSLVAWFLKCNGCSDTLDSRTFPLRLTRVSILFFLFPPQLQRKGPTALRCPTTTATSVWETPKPTTRRASRRSWCPAPTAAAQVRPEPSLTLLLLLAGVHAVGLPNSNGLHGSTRPPVLPAVHPRHDGRGQDVPLAVHRVQMLQHVRHFGERRKFTLVTTVSPPCCRHR